MIKVTDKDGATIAQFWASEALYLQFAMDVARAVDGGAFVTISEPIFFKDYTDEVPF